MPGPGKKFKKGQEGLGGKREGSGRPVEWFREECRRIIERGEILKFLQDVATGKDVEQRINDNGEVLKIPADVRDRMKASEMLMDRGLGKPVQQLEHSGEIEGRMIIVRPT